MIHQVKLLTNNEETTITDNDKNDIDINENIQTETPENKYTEPNTINNAENDMSFRDLQNEIDKAGVAGTNYTLKGNVSFAIDDPQNGVKISANNMVIDDDLYKT